jgi:hypothetical protein
MKAGYAVADITPPFPLELAGFIHRRGPSIGTIDPLTVKVLALQDGQAAPYLFFSFDLLGCDTPFCLKLRRTIKRRLVLPKDRVWINATHTHAAPAGMFFGDRYNSAYAALLLTAIQKAASEALDDLVSVRLYTGETAIEGIGSIRNVSRKEASYTMPVFSLRFVRETGKDILLLLFQCHPTVLGEDNKMFSRDLPGAWERAFQNKYCVFFMNGACADISTRYTRTLRGQAQLDLFGSLLGEATNKMRWKEAKCGTALPALHSRLWLPPAALAEDQERMVLREHFMEMEKNCTDAAQKRQYSSCIAALEQSKLKKSAIIPVVCVDIGPVVFLGLPLEISALQGQILRKSAGKEAGKPVWLVCYANGYVGYLHSGKTLGKDSTYEDLASPCGPGSFERVLKGVNHCIKKLMQMNSGNG